MSLWASLGTLESYIDFTGMQSTAMALVQGTVLQYWDEATYGPRYTVYFGVIGGIVMTFVGAAYAIVASVDAVYSLWNEVLRTGSVVNFFGLYSQYAGASSVADNLGYYEIAVFAEYQLWALVTVIVALVGGSQIWEATDARIAEADANSTGAETPLLYIKAVKIFVLCMISGLGTMISGYAIANSDKVINFFDFYNKEVANEGTQKTNSNNVDPDGTSAAEDIKYHMILSFYGLLVLQAISIGGQIFAFQYSGYNDALECDFQDDVVTLATYSGLFPIFNAMTNREECLATIDAAFAIQDLNGDGYIDRCEDAILQHLFGSTKEYATKFSGEFTEASYRKICYENFNTFGPNPA